MVEYEKIFLILEMVLELECPSGEEFVKDDGVQLAHNPVSSVYFTLLGIGLAQEGWPQRDRTQGTNLLSGFCSAVGH